MSITKLIMSAYLIPLERHHDVLNMKLGHLVQAVYHVKVRRGSLLDKISISGFTLRDQLWRTIRVFAPYQVCDRLKLVFDFSLFFGSLPTQSMCAFGILLLRIPTMWVDVKKGWSIIPNSAFFSKRRAIAHEQFPFFWERDGQLYFKFNMK